MTKTPYTLTVGTVTTVFSRKDRAVKAGEATGESFTVTNPSGKVVAEFTYATQESAQATITPEEAAASAAQRDADNEALFGLLATPVEDETTDEVEADEATDEVEGDELTAEALKSGKATKVVGESIIGLPTVARNKACKKGDDHEFRVTKSGGYCYTCDRAKAEEEKAARAAAKAQ